MKITSVNIKRYCRNFAFPLKSSQGTVFERAGYLIRLISDNNLVGLGEAAPLAGFSADTLDQTGGSINSAVSGLIDTAVPATLEQISTIVTRLIPQSNPAARFGLETALCDLAAKSAHKPLGRWLNEKCRDAIPVNYILPGPVTDWGKLDREIIAGGYGTVKIKVGHDIDEDVSVVRQARQVLGRRVFIRLDANRAWSYTAAEEAIWRLKSVNIEYIEEPHRMFDPARLRDLRRVTGVRVALDESLHESYDIESLITGGICDGFIFKPSRLGGIHRTMELTRLAGRHNRRVVITSTLETEIGLAAQLHLAAALEGGDRVCGLDTLRLFENPVASLCTVSSGAIRVPEGDGLGIDEEIWDRV